MWENDSSLQLDPLYLTRLVRGALERPDLELLEWQAVPIYSGFDFSSRIFRLAGRAIDTEGIQPWSLILKMIQPDEDSRDPRGFRYWQREALVYQSGLLKDLPAQISAPQCYDLCTQPDGSLWMCLEEVKETGGPAWSLEQYAQVARCLGEFNGAYLAGRPLPDQPWLSHDWLRRYLEHASPMVEFIRQQPGHPDVQDIFPGVTLAQTLAFWEIHPRLLNMLDEMPQTFCHQDAFHRNLFLRDGKVVAVDWSYTGIAPVGAELAVLVGGGVGLDKFRPSQPQDLDRICFSEYLEGLRRAGFQADRKQIRLAFALTLLLRYVFGGTIGESLPNLLNQDRRLRLSASYEKSAEEVAVSEPAVVAYYQALFLEILRKLGIRFTADLLARTVGHWVRLRRTKNHPAQGGP